VNGGVTALTGHCSGDRVHAFNDGNTPDSASKAAGAD
jgi:hypothetical protein